MAKTKSKKGLSDKVRNKQKLKSHQPPNPFEVKVNKIKHSVVNRKVQKWEKGVPGVSRSKAVKKVSSCCPYKIILADGQA